MVPQDGPRDLAYCFSLAIIGVDGLASSTSSNLRSRLLVCFAVHLHDPKPGPSLPNRY